MEDAPRPSLPPYNKLKRHAKWRDTQGRLYVAVAAAASTAPDSSTAAPEGMADMDALLPACFVLLPIGETRRRAAPSNTSEAQLEFPAPDDTVELCRIGVDWSVPAGTGLSDEQQDTLRVFSVERTGQRRAVALVTWHGTWLGAPATSIPAVTAWTRRDVGVQRDDQQPRWTPTSRPRLHGSAGPALQGVAAARGMGVGQRGAALATWMR